MLLRAFALGGEAGARLAKRIGLAASPAALISMIRRTPLADPPAARVLGVDDRAHRKGESYGTALVDLERHRLIELLPDRESETLSRWLRANPGTEVISRDRSEKYATGARQGAPGATQVADRWHLLRNWREAVKRSQFRNPNNEQWVKRDKDSGRIMGSDDEPYKAVPRER